MEERKMHCYKDHEMRVLTSPPPKDAKCYACARSFSESVEALYYACTDCEVMIHKKCAELPKQIDHPNHLEHPLVLLAKPPYESGTCKCQVCKNSCMNFVYHCSSCMFEIDVLCAFIEDITIPTHHHSLSLIRRQVTFHCDACGGIRYWPFIDDSYICTKQSCGFWIHKECGSLPVIFKRPDHEHPLLLATSMPNRYRKYKFTCELCPEKMGSKFWIYYCRKCKYFIHFKCITVKAQRYDYRNIYHEVPTLEMIRQLKTILLRMQPPWLVEEGPQLPEMKVYSHDHYLVLNSSGLDQLSEDEIICDGCIEPIPRSSPYYKCGQHCNFFLHATCAAFPKHALTNVVWVNMELELHVFESPWEVVKCYACNSFCSGYSYKCTISAPFVDAFTVSLDVKCLYFHLAGHIVHIGHKHYLHSNVGSLEKFTCSCCGNSMMGHCLECSCGFMLGYECAALPKTVKHKWDKHQLILCFPPHIRDTGGDEEIYCEVCEEEIHPKHWMYRCFECDHTFHPRCIPTLGESRNIKFGKTVSIHSHPHCLTLVSQVKLTSRCHTCKKSLHWSRAFECARCGFYLCPDCISKEELVVESSE